MGQHVGSLAWETARPGAVLVFKDRLLSQGLSALTQPWGQHRRLHWKDKLQVWWLHLLVCSSVWGRTEAAASVLPCLLQTTSAASLVMPLAHSLVRLLLQLAVIGQDGPLSSPSQFYGTCSTASWLTHCDNRNPKKVQLEKSIPKPYLGV